MFRMNRAMHKAIVQKGNVMTEEDARGRTPQNESDAGVVFANVTKSYGDREVLHSFNLSIGQGEMVCLLGPSGCGKSTALRCLAGFELISGGDIAIGGRSITRQPPRKRGIGMVFQHYSLFPTMTVRDNVAFGLKVSRVGKDERNSRALKMLERVGLAEYADVFPNRLSGGQQQRVALARALVTNPRVLLLDEPLSALDAKIRVQLRDEIRLLQQQLGITAIFVTHDQEEALAVADRIAIMHDGAIEQIGRPQDLYEMPATAFVADFVGQSSVVETVVAADGTVRVCGQTLPLLVHLPAKTLVRVFIRPENVVFTESPDGECTVESASYLGSFTRTTAVADGVRITSQHAPGNNIDKGRKVHVSIRPEPVMAERIELRWAQDARTVKGDGDNGA